MTTVRPDPKPVRRRGNAPRRIVDPSVGRRVLLADPECRLCGRSATNTHHVIRRGPPGFGDDVDANLIPVCGSGTTGCHGLLHAGDLSARVLLRSTLRPDELAYATGKVGEGILDRLYPPRGMIAS